MTINEIYEQSIKPLTPVDRLRLARMILNDIPAESFVDYDESWSDEDLSEFTRAGWQGADEETSDAIGCPK